MNNFESFESNDDFGEEDTTRESGVLPEAAIETSEVTEEIADESGDADIVTEASAEVLGEVTKVDAEVQPVQFRLLGESLKESIEAAKKGKMPSTYFHGQTLVETDEDGNVTINGRPIEY